MKRILLFLFISVLVWTGTIIYALRGPNDYGDTINRDTKLHIYFGGKYVATSMGSFEWGLKSATICHNLPQFATICHILVLSPDLITYQ